MYVTGCIDSTPLTTFLTLSTHSNHDDSFLSSKWLISTYKKDSLNPVNIIVLPRSRCSPLLLEDAGSAAIDQKLNILSQRFLVSSVML
ncbi:unnamed protein product [Brassica oleracea]